MLEVLVEAGILHPEKRRTWANFSLVPSALDTLAGPITVPAK